jgi:hypothetical protein
VNGYRQYSPQIPDFKKIAAGWQMGRVEPACFCIQQVLQQQIALYSVHRNFSRSRICLSDEYGSFGRIGVDADCSRRIFRFTG